MNGTILPASIACMCRWFAATMQHAKNLVVSGLEHEIEAGWAGIFDKGSWGVIVLVELGQYMGTTLVDFVEKVKGDKEVEQVCVPVRDVMLVIRRV